MSLTTLVVINLISSTTLPLYLCITYLYSLKYGFKNVCPGSSCAEANRVCVGVCVCMGVCVWRGLAERLKLSPRASTWAKFTQFFGFAWRGFSPQSSPGHVSEPDVRGRVKKSLQPPFFSLHECTYTKVAVSTSSMNLCLSYHVTWTVLHAWLHYGISIKTMHFEHY